MYANITDCDEGACHTVRHYAIVLMALRSLQLLGTLTSLRPRLWLPDLGGLARVLHSQLGVHRPSLVPRPTVEGLHRL